MNTQQSITIRAPIDLVWTTLIEIDQWPRWQKAVSAASLQGSLAPGAKFLWTSGGMKIQSIIQELEAPYSVRWHGSALGTNADHSWSLTSSGTETLVVTSEQMSGWLVSIMSVFSKGFLADSIRKTLLELKAEAERRNGT